MENLNIMKKSLFTLALLISFVSFGQTFDDYWYVKINSNDNGYDITSVAEGIFEEKGFTVLREGDVTPNDALKDPCLVLNCNIKYKRGKKGWSNSKIELSLIDCKKRVIYNKKASATTNFDTNDVAVNLSNATSGIMFKPLKEENISPENTNNKAKAIKELKEAKEMLDLGILSKEEYEIIAKRLKPIIIGN